MSMPGRSWYERHRDAAEVVALMTAVALLFLALGGGLYFLAVALNGWKG